MAEETSNGPVSAAEPPKANPLASPALKPAGTLQMKPVIRKPTIGGGALKPGLKLPPKPAGATPLKTVTTSSPLKAGLKIPATPTLKAGLKLPTKPVIRKPGSGVAPAPFKPATPAAPAAAAPAPAPAPAASAPVAAPVAAPAVAKPVAAPAVAKPISAEPASSSLTALKAVTQNLKSVTTAVPQQAILHKTGIIADPTKEMSEAQKQAAKSKTARISLSEAVGVAPVKNENAPMKTIRIKRPADLQPNGPAVAKTVVAAPVAAPVAAVPAAATADPAAKPAGVSVTQRKTLKITRPSEGVVRPAGKFGIKKPAAPAAAAAPAAPAAPGAVPDVGDVADIPDIPDIPAVAALPPVGAANDTVADVPAIVGVIGVIAQAAACVVIGALAWFLYQDAQIPLF